MKSRRILVANRGEIALRITRAIRELGHTALSVYSSADRNSRHVAKSSATYFVGEGPSIHSYLDIEAVLHAAKELKAEAIHPGYGFLAENAGFAQAVKDAGLIFIGPSPEAISTMGDKVKARQAMEKIGVPLIPGSKEGTTDEKTAQEQAKEIFSIACRY